MKTIKHNPKQIIVPFLVFLAIFGVFFYFRAFNLENRIIFDWDQESYATQIKEFVTEGNISLIGPRTTHDRGFFLAPYFTYLMLPFYVLAKLHPSGSIGFVLTYNIIFFLVAAFSITKLFNWRIAAAFLAFWSIHFWMIEYDTIPWWPIVIPLGVLATWQLLKLSLETNRLHWWALLGFTMGLFINMHFQYIFILLFVGMMIGLHYILTNQIHKKGLLALGACFASMFTPLLIFDLRHDFMNAKLFFNFFFGSGNDLGAKTRFEWIPVMTNFFQPFLYVKNDLLTLLFYAAIAGILVYLARTKTGYFKTFYIVSTLLWLLTVIFFIAYGQRPSEYYFIYLVPFILIACLDFLYSVRKPVILFVLLALFGLMNLYPATKRLETHIFGLHTKEKTVKYLDQLQTRYRFNVSFDVAPGREPGYGYLLKYYGIPKHNEGNPSDPLIEVRIPPKEPSDVRITNDIGLKIPSTIQYGK